VCDILGEKGGAPMAWGVFISCRMYVDHAIPHMFPLTPPILLCNNAVLPCLPMVQAFSPQPQGQEGGHTGTPYRCLLLSSCLSADHILICTHLNPPNPSKRRVLSSHSPHIPLFASASHRVTHLVRSTPTPPPIPMYASLLRPCPEQIYALLCGAIKYLSPFTVRASLHPPLPPFLFSFVDPPTPPPPQGRRPGVGSVHAERITPKHEAGSSLGILLYSGHWCISPFTPAVS